MTTTRAALQAIADGLTAAGVPATTDPRSMVAPCVLLERPSNVVPTMCGLEVTAAAWVISPGPWTANAWDALDALVAQVLELVEWASVSYQRVYVTADGELPAVEITLAPFEIAN